MCKTFSLLVLELEVRLCNKYELMFTIAFKSHDCEKLSNYFDFSLLKLHDFILSLTDRNLIQQM